MIIIAFWKKVNVGYIISDILDSENKMQEQPCIVTRIATEDEYIQSGIENCSLTIFANRLKLVYKNGMVVDFTHVTFLRRNKDRLIVHGETDDGTGMRVNVNRAFKLERLRLMITEFYTPRT